jgi:formate-dependent nitrite reductase membrane component NrfD
MIPLADAEHFAVSPDWTWYILFYFFLAGLCGGSYFLSCLMRLNGNDADEPAARVGFYISFVTLLGCPVLLTLDLGKPSRFWHMLVNTTPGNEGLNFKYWSPMSVGAWGLAVFGIFATVSFVDALARDGKLPFFGWLSAIMRSPLGWVWHLLGGLVGLFIAGYTGVLLAVSNQPVWSDTWVLGGVFLASGLTGAAALMRWLIRYRADARASDVVFARFDRVFSLLELALILVFGARLIAPGTWDQAFGLPWLVLWAVVLIGLLPGLIGVGTHVPEPAPDGTAAARSASTVALVSIIVLVGILALRAAIIFSAQ